jgi:hypothetical protein
MVKYDWIDLIGIILVIAIVCFGFFHITKWLDYQAASESCHNSLPIGDCNCISGFYSTTCSKETNYSWQNYSIKRGQIIP